MAGNMRVMADSALTGGNRLMHPGLLKSRPVVTLETYLLGKNRRCRSQKNNYNRNKVDKFHRHIYFHLAPPLWQGAQFPSANGEWINGYRRPFSGAP